MNPLQQLLDRLELDSGSNLYVLTSFNYLRHLGLTPAEIVTTLLQRCGPQGTLAMPSFAWNRQKGVRLWSNYQLTYEQAPIFDWREDPCNVGIIPETFRQFPGSQRALAYWYPICAQGPLAEALCQPCLHDLSDHDPQGDGTFARLLRHNFTVLGLGVTSNTTSLSFLADLALGPDHPQQLLSQQLKIGRIRDGHKLWEHPGYWMVPEAIQSVKPSLVISASQQLQGEYREAKVGDAIHFCYPSQAYQTQALLQGRQAIAAGQGLPWLPNYPLKQTP